MRAVTAVVLLIFMPSSFCLLEQGNNETILVLSLDRVEIPLVDNGTNFIIQFDPSFVCPIGHQCEISLEIEDINCEVGDVEEDDPSYFISIPLRTLDGRENFGLKDRDMKCETFEGENGRKVLKLLERFDMESVFVFVTGEKWELGEATVNLFAKITITKIYIMDASMQDLELQITGFNSTEYQIRFDEANLESCATDSDFSCSIFGILKEMTCTGNLNSLQVRSYAKDGTRINSIDICNLTTRPLDAFKFESPIGMIELSPVGDWESDGTYAVITFTIHFQSTSGGCPSGYFSCRDCAHTFGNPNQGPTSCIPNVYVCDKRPHCGLPCYADESNAICKSISDSTCYEEYHEVQRYTNDLNSLYVFLIQIFFWTSALTIIVVLGITFFFSYKMNRVGQRMTRLSKAQAEGGIFKNVEFLPPNYMTTTGTTEKLNEL